MPTITRLVHVPSPPRPQGQMEDLNDLTQMLRVLDERRPHSMQGREEIRFSAEDNVDSFWRKQRPAPQGWQGAKILDT